MSPSALSPARFSWAPRRHGQAASRRPSRGPPAPPALRAPSQPARPTRRRPPTCGHTSRTRSRPRRSASTPTRGSVRRPHPAPDAPTPRRAGRAAALRPTRRSGGCSAMRSCRGCRSRPEQAGPGAGPAAELRAGDPGGEVLPDDGPAGRGADRAAHRPGGDAGLAAAGGRGGGGVHGCDHAVVAKGGVVVDRAGVPGAQGHAGSAAGVPLDGASGAGAPGDRLRRVRTVRVLRRRYPRAYPEAPLSEERLLRELLRVEVPHGCDRGTNEWFPPSTHAAGDYDPHPPSARGRASARSVRARLGDRCAARSGSHL